MRGWPEEPVTEVARCSWPAALRAAITGEELRCFFQPIVDRRGTVVGYEALARMESPAGPVGPVAWFTAARVHGMSAALEAACLGAAFSHRPTLPSGCFLSVNVGPHVLAHPSMRQVLETEGDLTGVVLELTEHVTVETDTVLRDDLDRYRSAGARVAVDDAGTGRAGRRCLVDLRPSIIKLDRELVTGIDGDDDKRARVHELAAFAYDIDAVLLAEGVERVEELDALVDLPVPLVQGFALARPAPPWQGIDPEIADRLRRRTSAEAEGALRPMARQGAASR